MTLPYTRRSWVQPLRTHAPPKVAGRIEQPTTGASRGNSQFSNQMHSQRLTFQLTPMFLKALRPYMLARSKRLFAFTEFGPHSFALVSPCTVLPTVIGNRLPSAHQRKIKTIPRLAQSSHYLGFQLFSPYGFHMGPFWASNSDSIWASIWPFI